MNFYFFFSWCLTKVIYCPFGHTRAQIYSFQYCRLSLRMKKKVIEFHATILLLETSKQTKGYDLSSTPNYPNLRKAYIFLENCVSVKWTSIFLIYDFSNGACFSEIHHINLYSNGKISSNEHPTTQNWINLHFTEFCSLILSTTTLKQGPQIVTDF